MNTAEYLIKKLEELGIIDFFGLPGDYNFNILNAIESNPNTNWIGCSNELNAGYAADGYARENGYGALVTTYGVGELSALNSIAGSYSENVSVINIVGVPNTKSIINKTCSHHNFQEVEPFIYSEIFRNVTETVAFLNRDNAKLEIDRVLKVFVKERKPVYIAVPLDIATMDISEREADYSWSSSQDTLESLVNIIMDKINKSKNPMILGDVLIKRFSAELEYREFVEKSSFPTVNLLMGTNLIDSELKNNLGTFFSDYLNINAKKCLYESDCIISVGFICGTFNSFGEDLSKKIKSNIQISGTYTCVDGIKYENIKMSELLEKLSERVESREIEVEKTFVGYEKVVASDKKITSSYIYPRLQEFLKENETIGFVAPSCGCAKEPYRSAFENALRKWKEKGFIFKQVMEDIKEDKKPDLDRIAKVRKKMGLD